MSWDKKIDPFSSRTIPKTSNDQHFVEHDSDLRVSEFAQGRFERGQENVESQRSRSFQCLNSLSADFVGFVSRILIERVFFQNPSIPTELLLYLANDVITALAPEKEETFNLGKEASLLWKQMRGQTLTAEEQLYQDTPKQLNVLGEILNGVKYSSMALLGQNLYSSITSACSQGLWGHIPYIVGYSGALLAGATVISRVVDSTLQFSGLNQEQKTQLKPWLNMIGRLAIGFTPKVHATEQGVYYHYPSMEGSSQKYSWGETITLGGDDLTIEREFEMGIPEGTFKGAYIGHFKLHRVYELNDQLIRLQVKNPEGKIVPVEFTLVEGCYGPEMKVTSEDKRLEEHWSQYFRPKPRFEEKDALTLGLGCQAGVALGTLGALALRNPLPLALGGTLCTTSVSASPLLQIDQEKEMIDISMRKGNYKQALQKSSLLIQNLSEKTPAEVYYRHGSLFRKLGDYHRAYEAFNLAEAKDPAYSEDYSVKEMREFHFSPTDVSFRNRFLQGIGMSDPNHNVPTAYVYIAMGVLVNCFKNVNQVLYTFERSKSSETPVVDELINQIMLNRETYEFVSLHFQHLQKLGWQIDSTSPLESTEHLAIVFFHPDHMNVIVAHSYKKESSQPLKRENGIYKACENWMNKIREDYASYTISHAGYSLGGDLAQLLAEAKDEIAVTPDPTNKAKAIELLKLYDWERGGLLKDYRSEFQTSGHSVLNSSGFGLQGPSMVWVERRLGSSMKLSSFSKKAQIVLQDYHSYSQKINLNLYLENLFEIQGDEVVLLCNRELYPIEDFKHYIEQKVRTVSINCFQRDSSGIKVPKMSDEYVIFMSLNAIKELPPVDLEILKGYLKQGNLNSFLTHLASAGGGEDKIKEKINSELIPYKILNSDISYNYDTLISEIFNQDVDKYPGFLSLIHEPEEYFEKKRLSIYQKKALLITGAISSLQRSNQVMQFKLSDQSLITIRFKKNCEIEGIRLQKYSPTNLLNYLLKARVLQTKFTIAFVKDIILPPWIHSGEHQIESIKTTLSGTKIFSLRALETNCIYEIEIYFDKKNTEVTKAVLFEKTKKNSTNFQEISGYHQNHFLAGYLAEEQKVKITNDDINETIIIEPLVHNEKIQIIEEIRKLENELVLDLLEKSNDTYLNDFLGHLIKEQLNVKRLDLLEGVGSNLENLKKKLENINALYKEIGEPKSTDEILKRIILEANYQRAINKDLGFTVSELMELLAQLNLYVKDMKGKELIIFLGMTGSGKGTSINFLLGNQLSKKTNAWSQTIYDLQEGQIGPKIGHSIANSQTLYAQGFALPNTPFLLCDTPGFADTRGETHDLIAHLSIDQAIDRAEAIKAVVITIPLQVFLLDKGNPVLYIFEYLDKLLRDLYSEEIPAGIYILVTQHGNYTEKDLQSILQEHCPPNEAQDQSRRKKWGFLCKMNKEKRISLIRLDSLKHRLELLETLKKSPGLNKDDRFFKFMENDARKSHFAVRIQNAASSWTYEIIDRYLHKIPLAIEEGERNIQSYRLKIKNCKTIIKKIQEEISKCEDPANRDCLGSVLLLYNDELNQIKREKAKLKDNQRKTKEKIEKLRKTIKKIEESIQERSIGTMQVDLWKYQPLPNEMMEYCTLKDGARQRARDEFRETNAKDCINEVYDHQVVNAEFTGPMGINKLINVDYRIVPEDIEKRKEFEKQGFSSDGVYEAIILGDHWKIDLDRKPHPQGYQILYFFQTDWEKGRGLPWIQIIHKIPKAEYYHKDLADDNKKVAGFKGEIKGLETLLLEQNKLVAEKEKDEKIKQQQLEESNKKERRKQIKELEENSKKQAEQIIQEEKRIQKQEEEIAKLDREKKYLALIVKTRWRAAEALYEFCLLASPSQRMDAGPLVKTCENYRNYFQNNQTALLNNCAEDLQFDCREN